MNGEEHDVAACEDVRGITGGRAVLLLLPVALLLGLSLGLMPVYMVHEGSRTFVALKPLYAIRQGLAGVAALALALAIGRWLPTGRTARLAWVPLAVFALAVIAALLSLWAGWGFLVKGTYWFQRSPGLLITYLAMLGGLVIAMPRFAEGGRRGWPAFLGALAFALLVPLVVLHRVSDLFILFGMAGLCLLCTATGRRLWTGLSAMVAATLATILVLASLRPALIERFVFPDREALWQLQQALFAIHCRGRYHLPGIGIPEAHTDFLFAHLCGIGGLLLGLSSLCLVGLLLVSAWRVAGRQQRLDLRTLGAGCAALLTLRSLFHVAVNLGLFPTMPVGHPFLSYGPILILLDGVSIGVLLALDRDHGTAASTSRSRWPARILPVAVGLLLGLFMIRMLVIVYATPDLVRQRDAHIQRIKDREAERERPVRGRMLDTQGCVLAWTGEAKTLFVDPHLVRQWGEASRYPEVASLLRIEPQGMDDILNRTNSRYVVVLRDAPPATVDAVRHLSLKSLGIQAEFLRRYPEAAPLAHVAGAVNHEGMGLCGVELAYHARLAAGHDVRLTINVGMQASVHAIAETALRETGARELQIIVMNPRTGAIHVAVQIPATHAAKSPAAEPRARTWRSLIDVFEPGGLIQPLVVASALDAGVISAETPIDCEGGAWSYEGIPLRDPVSHATMTPEQLLVRAGNIGMAKIGLLLGKEALHDALLGWGVLQPLEVGRGMGGGKGVLAQPTRWSSIDITRIPIGHAIALSLLQVCRAYTAFFNEGAMVEPRLVEEERERDTERAEVASRITPETAARVRSMLVRVVEEGTGRAARIEGAEVFGKTAVVHKPIAGGYDPERVQVAFVGGFETGEGPVLIAVWLDEPERQFGGLNPSVGVFRRAAQVIKTAREQQVRSASGGHEPAAGG